MSTVFNSVEEILEPGFDKDNLCWNLTYEYELNFKNSDEIKGLAHDLAHLESHIFPNGLCTYLDNIEHIDMVNQALGTLEAIESPNYEILKNALTKVEIDEDGLIETDDYDDEEDWNKWSYEDADVLLKFIEKNKNKFI